MQNAIPELCTGYILIACCIASHNMSEYFFEDENDWSKYIFGMMTVKYKLKEYKINCILLSDFNFSPNRLDIYWS